MGVPLQVVANRNQRRYYGWISMYDTVEHARLAICTQCILSICNIYLFPVLVLRAGFAF